MFFRRQSTVPAPFLVKATGQFDGNDGNWSTFDLKVGSQPQEFRVLVSTSGDISWLPAAEGCASVNEAGCGDMRGVDTTAAGSSPPGYNDSLSSTSTQVGTDQVPLSSDLTMNDAFGSTYNISATTWQDSFQLTSGLGSQTVQNTSLFAAVSSPTLFLGSFGLGIGNVTNKIINKPSFMELLVQAGSIPSNSWGYTAGAYYRGNGGYAGNLVLGGYDQSRFDNSSAVTFDMPQSIQQSLLRVTLASIQFDSWSPPGGNVQVILDSTLPYLYLPGDMVDALAQHLGLQYDNNTDLYLINDTQRTNNKNSIHSVTIDLADVSNGNTLTSISLSYDAFDHSASWPTYDNATPYFPIRKAQNNNNILGRVFFQEAYVVANYEQRNFSIAQTTFKDQAPAAQLVPILSNSFTPPSPSKSHGLSGGAIAGIVVGSIAAVAIAVAAAWFFIARRRKANLKKELEQRKMDEDDADRRRRMTMISMGSGTVVTDEGTMVSHEMEALSPVDGQRPAHSRHLSELSSDSEVSGARRKPRNSAIYELEGGAPDAEAWQQNEQRMNRISTPTPLSPLQSEVPPDSPPREGQGDG